MSICIVGPIYKNPPKIRLKKFVKWIDLTYVCNSLTIFLNLKGMKRNYVNLLKPARKILWNHCRWIYFWRVLAIWTHLASQFANSYAKVARRLTAKNWFTSPDYHSYHFIRIRINATVFIHIHSIQIRQKDFSYSIALPGVFDSLLAGLVWAEIYLVYGASCSTQTSPINQIKPVQQI